MTSSEQLAISSSRANSAGSSKVAPYECPGTNGTSACASISISTSLSNSKSPGTGGRCATATTATATTAASSSSGAVSSISAKHQKAPKCFGCQKPIFDRYLLKALEQVWHEDCLKCSCCNCRLGEIGSTLFTKADLILCKRDYLRMFGTTGMCSACNKGIPSFEMVLRAKANVYHLECFKCEICSHRFCVGDRFYLHDNKILCEYDYDEQMALNQFQQQQQQFYQSLEQQQQQASKSVSTPTQQYSNEPDCVAKSKSYGGGEMSFAPGPSHFTG